MGILLFRMGGENAGNGHIAPSRNHTAGIEPEKNICPAKGEECPTEPYGLGGRHKGTHKIDK